MAALRHQKAKELVDLEQPGAGWGTTGWRKTVCTSDELPEWYAPSPHIRSGYRVGYDGCACAGSVFEAHNETMNVWTHLVGGAYFCGEFCRRAARVAAAAWRARRPFGAATVVDECTVVVFAAGACFMLLASAAYHTFHPVSEAAARRWLALDKCGIAVMIAASFVPGTWLGLRCAGDAARLCWLGASAAILALGLALGLGAVKERHHARAFAGLVASGVAPTLHFVVATPRAQLDLFIPKLLLMFGLYGLGFACYLSRWPEALFPGKVDLVGSSHQLWHVCVLGAALAWYSDVAAFISMLEADAPVLRCPAEVT